MKLINFLLAFTAMFALSFIGVQAFNVEPGTAATVAFAIVLTGTYLANKFKLTGIAGAYVGAVKMNDGETGIQVISQERDRAIYEHNSSQKRFEGKAMTPSYLRLEATIKNSVNSFQFKTFEGDGATVYATEKRLDRNDAFIATQLAVKLLQQDVANAKTSGRLHSYPNLTAFTAAQATDLEAIYNGYLQFTINRVKKFVALDTYRFLNVPITQQSALTNRDSLDYKTGFQKLTPQVVLDGSGTNELELFFPTYAGWAGASAVAGTEHRVVLFLRGFLVTGGSQNS
ncbi:MAG: hypothetical protein EKK37_17360 [Sphingobacteriales bacterium]|nr:MAG: hypothetical protein EKK37_17360 [Sphingobacteriales bacterium]